MEAALLEAMLLGRHVVDCVRRTGDRIVNWKRTNERSGAGIVRRIGLFLFVLLGFGLVVQARDIVDMFGKRVSIPDRVQRVYSASPPVTYMLYAIDPTVLAGLNFPVREWEKKYLRKEMQSLPVLGGWFGQGDTPNMETVLRQTPRLSWCQNQN